MLILKKKYFNLRPAVFITAGFISGILSGYLQINSQPLLAVALFLATVLAVGVVAIYSVYKKDKFKAAVFFVTAFAVVIGLLLITFDLNPDYENSGTGYFSGRVYEIYSENVVDGGYVYSLTLKGDFLNNENALCYAKITSSERIFYGSRLNFYGNFSLIDSSSSDVFYEVDRVTSLHVGNLNGLIPIMRHRLLTCLETHAGDMHGLIYALLTGDTSYVSQDVMYKYQQVGIAHLFAVSGLHIGLMYGLLSTATKFLKSNSKFRFLTIVFILICYVGFCGFSPSSMRAFVIITVREFAYLSGNKPDSTTNLSISALIVLLINSTDLFSVSFLLSFSVYLGLILLATPLARVFSKIFPKTLSKLLSSCIVAQAVSFPILIDCFGSASIFSFLFNMALIPFVSFFYPFIFISCILLAVFNLPVFAIIPGVVFAAMDFFLEKANVDLFMLKNLSFGYSSVFYYFLLYLFAGKFNISAKSYNVLRIITLSLTILTFCLVNTIDFFGL